MEVRLLGSVNVDAGEGPVHLGGAKERALLALLAAEGGPVSQERLVSELWRDASPIAARKALQTSVWRLRSVLPRGVVVRAPGGYELRVDGELDVVRFERLVLDGGEALDRGDVEHAAQCFDQAIALWHGEPFAGSAPTETLQAHASWYAELRSRAVEGQLEAALRLGRHAEVVGELEHHVRTTPLRERLWAMLALTLYRCGRQAEALRACQRARTVLAEEIGVGLGPELVEIERAILEHRPGLCDVSFVDVGPPTTKLDDGATARAGRPCTGNGNLPVQATSFVGRDSAVLELTTLMRDRRLVTLTGVGGVGKTRLALQVAAEVSAHFPDGVWFVDLASVGGAAVANAAAAVLDIAAGGELHDTERISTALSGRRLLLVLDNCEHVLDAAAELVDAILAWTETVKVIATSREGLAVTAEQLWPVPPLDVDAGIHSAAVELFVERSRAVLPTFVLDHDAEAVAEICRRLDGIPLAIELAAAHMVSMSPADVLERWSERFRLLTRPRRGPSRHQTLQAAVQWSYELLDDREQAMLLAASVFADGFDVAAARHVCGDEEPDECSVLNLLDSLVRKSLVLVDRLGGHTRYRMLETIRQFADDQLAASGRTSEMRTRHAHFFARQVVAHWDIWDGPRQRVALDWIDVEFENLRTAFRWAANEGDVVTAAAIAAHTAMMAGASQRYAPAAWAEEILDVAIEVDLPQLPRLYAAAAYCSPTGRPEVSIDYARRAVALEGNPRYDPFEPGWGRLMEAHGLRFAGRVDQQLAIYTELATGQGLARVLGLCGMLYALPIRGRSCEARGLADATVAAARSHGNPCWIAWTFDGRARAFADVDPDAALASLREGLAYTREHRLPYWESILARDAARLEAVHGELERALALFDRTIESFHRAGNTASVAATLADLAVLFHLLKRPHVAATIYGRSTHHDSAQRTDNLRGVLDHLRAALGLTEFNELVTAGAAMNEADAVHFARRHIQLAVCQLAEARAACADHHEPVAN